MNLPDHIKKTANLSSDDEKEIVSSFQLEKYSKGQHLFRQGEICNKIYFIEKGFIRLYYFSQDGRDVTIWFSAENSFFTAVDSYYYRKETHDNCEFLEDSVLYSISYSSMEMLLNKSHNSAKMAFFALYDITSTIVKYIVSTKFQSAQEKYNALLSNYPLVFQRVPLVHIASFLGITPETLSRLRSVK